MLINEHTFGQGYKLRERLLVRDALRQQRVPGS